MQDQRYERTGRHASDGPAPTPIDGYGQVSRPASHRVGPPSSRAKIRWRVGIGIGLMVIAIFCALAAFSTQFRHQVEISVVRQGTPYTQLYFASPTKLPTELKTDKNNTVGFTIENDEGHAYRYTYIVTLDDFRSGAVTSKDTVAIGDGDRATSQIVVTPKDRKSKYLITISLEGMNQSIHFYAETS
jgi:hypothetical protein